MEEKKHKTKLKYKYYILLKVVIILLLTGAAFHLFHGSVSILKTYKMNYNEKSNVDYEVCLKQNDFFEEKCLRKDMKYIANLIDNVRLNMDYIFTTDQSVSSTYTYSVIGKLIISDPDNDKNIIFSKNYTLVKETVEEISNNKIYDINKIININYSNYNELANQFKATYGISSNARLEIHMYINNNTKSISNSNLNLVRNSDVMISLPLSESSINVKLDYATLNNSDVVAYETNNSSVNDFHLVCAIFATLVSIDFIGKLIVHIIRKNKRKSKYQKYLEKILRNYDRVIVESSSTINVNDYSVIMVKSFEELLDVRDNLSIPIVFNEIIKDKKSWFYVKHENDLYLFVLKSNDAGD